MTWEDEYKSKFISAEDAANLVKSGNVVVFTAGREAHAVGLAIAARLGELKNVTVYAPTPGYDFGWYDPGWKESFDVVITMPTGLCQDAVDQKRVDVFPSDLIPFRETGDMAVPDVLLTEISPPDEKGFSSFGQSLWDKKAQVKKAKVVIAEVNKNLIRTHGDNFIHVSEIDYFVEHIYTGEGPAKGSLGGRKIKEFEPYLKDIAGYVAELIPNGATIQIGIGRTTEPLVKNGLLDNKGDIGYHSEATPQGIIDLIRKGVINGSRKTLNQGKAIVTSLGGGSKEEMDWASQNPLIHLVDVSYLEDIRIIAAHDNMIAINQALSLDLTGQVNAESLGPRIMSAAGGQIAFALGALISKGGRAITVLPSTARAGKLSRITPLMPEGSTVTVQRNCVDCVVTEYGIARLKGKTLRQRAQELIAVAHPDFRAELRKKAQQLYGL